MKRLYERGSEGRFPANASENEGNWEICAHKYASSAPNTLSVLYNGEVCCTVNLDTGLFSFIDMTVCKDKSRTSAVNTISMDLEIQGIDSTAVKKKDAQVFLVKGDSGYEIKFIELSTLV